MRLLVCLMVVLISATGLAQGGPPGGGGSPPLSNHPGVYIDQRDYQGNRTTTDRMIFPAPHPALEYSFTTNQVTNVTHVAYTKGSTITAQLRFKNDTDFPFSGNLNFISARLACPGLPSGTEYLPLTISSSQSSLALPAHGTASVTVTIGGAPNYIAVGGLEVKYSLILMKNPGPDQEGPYENGTGQSGWENWVRVCLLDSTPIGLQAVPWTDFLEYTCRWAFGASGTTQVLSEMTKGIFSGNRCPATSRLKYSSLNRRYWQLGPISISPGNYKLKLFLSDLGDPNAGPAPESRFGNCADFAGLLHLALLSHGVQTDCHMYKSPSVEDFSTWPLCPAGKDPAVITPVAPEFEPGRAGNYHSEFFSFHVVVDHSGQTKFDASNAYYFASNGSLYLQPAIAWSAANYWQRSSHPYYGLAYLVGPFFLFTLEPLGVNSQPVTQVLTTGHAPEGLE